MANEVKTVRSRGRPKKSAEAIKPVVKPKVEAKPKPEPKPKKVKSSNPLDNMTQAQLRALLKKVQQEECRRTYSKYVEYAHTPNGADKSLWLPAKHLLYLCGKVQDFVEADTGHSFDTLVLSMPPQHGKALADETPVLTTNGWRKHGDLKAGDFVYGADGLPKRVLHAQDSYMHDCVTLTLDSGDEFVCAREHEWVVECNRDKKIWGRRVGRLTEVLEAQHIFDGYHAKSPAIKVCEPLKNYTPPHLPIDPYLLGLWLGNGTCACADITVHRDDCEEYKRLLTRRGHLVTARDTSGGHKILVIGKTNGKRGSNYFLNQLKANGMLRNKHIPEAYFIASHSQRLDLLHGLMDTDGTVAKSGCTCQYNSISRRLADDVYKLVRGLGFKCTIHTGRAMLNGRYICDDYTVQFTPCKGEHIFNLRRKQARVDRKAKRDRGDKKLYFIKAVEPCGEYRVKCITVAGGVYLAGHGMVPTHNSMSITETLPSWYMGKWPDKRVILASYNDETAERFCRRNKEKIRAVGKELFGIEISPVIDRATEFEIKGRMGRMISRGIMAGITSNAADLLIIDDPVKNRQEADSETYRDRQWDEWLNTLRTRLSAGAKVIVIQTRWHEDDLAGRIAASERNVTVINLPCEAEGDDPLGREVGEALAPEIGKGNDWLADFKHALIDEQGSRVWNALYQGHPSFAEGNLIKREWWKYYDDPTDESMKYKKLPELQSVIMSVDAAFKDGDDNDPVSIQVWGKYGEDYFLVDNLTQRLSFSQTVAAIRMMHDKHQQIKAIFIEDKANGSAIIDVLQKDIRGIFPINPMGGKVARVNAVSGRIEAGHVHLPKFATFTQGFIDECAAFPNGAHDDQCDSAAYALSQLIFYSDKIPVTIAKKLKWTADMREDYKNANKDDKAKLLDRWGRPN